MEDRPPSQAADVKFAISPTISSGFPLWFIGGLRLYFASVRPYYGRAYEAVQENLACGALYRQRGSCFPLAVGLRKALLIPVGRNICDARHPSNSRHAAR